MAKPKILQTLNDHTSQLIDIVQQNYYKIFPKEYNGFNMYVPFDSTYGTYQSVIDTAISFGAKCINICIRLNMSSISSQTVTVSTTQVDLVNAVNYVKSKGLKIFIKPHMNYSSKDIYDNVENNNVQNIRNWITSYSNALVQAVTWVKNDINFVGISNELNYQTFTNLDLWQSLISSIKALNSNIKISCSMKAIEIETNVYLPYIDFIGCNMYLPIIGNLTTPLDDLKKSIFTFTDSLKNYIDIIHQKNKLLNKPIFITEIGILPIIDSWANPGTWSYDTTYYNNNKNLDAQTIYYKVALGTFINDTTIDGIMIWSLTDSFTPIGNTNVENLIKLYFGGIN